MSAPRRQPSGFVKVTSTASMQGRIEVFGFGQDDRAISPGDLVIVTTDYVMENAHRQKIEFCLQLKGRDMHLFADASRMARLMWDDNKHWLNAGVNDKNVDTRSLTAIRQADQIATLSQFLKS
jgi:hypothetical protein